MPDHDLSPAAQAFLTDLSAWLPGDELERARVGLAGLLAGERAPCACWGCHRRGDYTDGTFRLDRSFVCCRDRAACAARIREIEERSHAETAGWFEEEPK